MIVLENESGQDIPASFKASASCEKGTITIAQGAVGDTIEDAQAYTFTESCFIVGLADTESTAFWIKWVAPAVTSPGDNSISIGFMEAK